MLLGLTALSVPRFIASVAQWPGFEAIERAGRGEDLHPNSYERARRSLENAARVLDHRALSTDLAVIHHNLGRQMRDRDSRDAFYDESQAAALHSLALSPVQPLAWFLLAQIAYEREAYGTAADTLDWAVRTSHYMRHQARARALLALALWDLVDEATRVRSMAAVVDVITREIDVVADFATASGAETDLLRRLRSTEPGGVLLAARFQAAVNRSRHQAELQRIAYEEFSAMRQALIATSMLVTAAMPLPTLAMSVHDYMEIRRGDHPTRQPDSVDEYLSAVLDGLLVLGYFNREEGTALFCVPDRHVLDINVLEFRANLDLLLEQFAAEMPNFDALARTRSVGLVSLELLTVLYPCDD